MKGAIPTESQAKRLAHLWGMNAVAHIGIYDSPTDKVLVREGWIEPNGVTGDLPSGSRFIQHVISPEGVAALARYFATL